MRKKHEASKRSRRNIYADLSGGRREEQTSQEGFSGRERKIRSRWGGNETIKGSEWAK